MKKKTSFFLSIFFVTFTVSPAWSVQVYDYDSSSYLSLVKHQDTNASSYAFKRVGSPRRAGCFSGRFELRPGDRWVKDGASQERSELSEDNYQLLENSTAFYGFSIRIPTSQLSDCQNTADCKEWRNYMQWHAKPSDDGNWSHPLLTLSLDNGLFSFILAKPNGSKWYTKLNPFSVKGDTWIDFVVEFRWSKQANQGVIRIWRDGKLIVNRPNEQVGYNDQASVFWKHGVYRRPVADKDVIYFDELRRGVSYREVVPRTKECKTSQSIIPILSLLLLKGDSEKK